MSKHSSSKKKFTTEVWVALIGLLGIIITAILSSPVLVKMIESTPIPSIAPTQMPLPTAQSISTALPISTASTADLSGCLPAPFSELPPQTMAIIEPDEGATSQVPLRTLRYEKMSQLRLASGIAIDFKRMKSFELFNKDFKNRFTTDVVVTLLDCKTYQDVIQSESGSFLTGETEQGPLELHILKVGRVDFQW